MPGGASHFISSHCQLYGRLLTKLLLVEFPALISAAALEVVLQALLSILIILLA